MIFTVPLWFDLFGIVFFAGGAGYFTHLLTTSVGPDDKHGALYFAMMLACVAGFSLCFVDSVLK